MWPFPAISRYSATLYVHPSQCILALFVPPLKKQHPLLQLQCIHINQYECSLGETEHGALFNPSAITHWLQQELTPYICNQLMRLSIVVTGSSIIQQLHYIPTMQPTFKDFAIERPRHHWWTFTHLGAYEDTQLWYVSGIPKSVALGWIVCAKSIHAHVQHMTTSKMGMLQTYKAVKGSSFRVQELSHDLVQHHGTLENTITPELLRRLITFTTDIPTISDTALISIIGAALYEKHLFY